MKKIYMCAVTAIFLIFSVNSHAVEVDILGGVDIHGFISQGYMESKDNNYLIDNSSDGSFAFNEVGINFSKQLTDQLRIGLQLFSYDLGAMGNNEIMLDWAFADYRWKDWLGLRAGKIKAPHGLYNESRDMDMLRTSIFLPQSVYPELNRATMTAIQGLGVYGDVPAGPVGSISYQLLAGTMDVEGEETNGAVRQFNTQPDFEVTGDFEFDHVYIISVDWQTPLDGLLFKYTYRTSELEIPALAGGVADVTYEIGKHSTWVGSVEYTWNDLMLAAEYTKTRSDSQVTLDSTGMVVADLGIMKNHGYYVSASYRFNDWFEAGAYYSKYYADSDDKGGDDGVASGRYMYDFQGWLEDYALSLRFDINEYWVAKLEGHLMDGAAYCLSMDNDDYRKSWHYFAAKLSFSF
jgi:hypothetical protein